jgi:acyl carrier protein
VRSPAPILDSGAAREWIVGYLADILQVDHTEVDLAKGLDSFGLDSVDAVIMGAAMEEEFGIELDPTVFIEHRNFQGVLEWLSGGGADVSDLEG